MSDSGWIKLHRSIEDHPRRSDPYWVAVWVHLLLSATYRPVDRIFDGRVTTLKPGQLVTGRKLISLKTGVSESTVERILKRMQIEQQIEQQSSSTSRLITIVKWESFQSTEQQNGQRTDSERTAGEQRTDTVQELKKGRREEKDTPKPPEGAGEVVPEKMEKPRNPRMALVGDLFKRKPSTPWSSKEEVAFKRYVIDCPDDDFQLIQEYYQAKIEFQDIRRRDVQTLLNNWPGELDRARAWKDGKVGIASTNRPPTVVPTWKQIAAIEEQISNHPANRSSRYFEPSHTPEHKAALKVLRDKLDELKKQEAA